MTRVVKKKSNPDLKATDRQHRALIAACYHSGDRDLADDRPFDWLVVGRVVAPVFHGSRIAYG